MQILSMCVTIIRLFSLKAVFHIHKLLNIFQLFVVFPILVYAVRLQIFNFFYGNDYPSKKLVMIYSISALILSLIVVYIASEYLAELIGIIGACTTLILVYTFPPIVKIIDLYLKKKKISVEKKKKKKFLLKMKQT